MIISFVFLVSNKLNENLKFTKLWENQNPSVAFSAQKITLDLSKYEIFMIEYMPSTSYNTTISYQMSPKTASGFYALLNACIMDTSLWRNLTIDDTGITFTGGRFGANASESDGVCVPVRIYGKP